MNSLLAKLASVQFKQSWVVLGGVTCVVVTLGTFAAVGAVLVQLPDDYFTDSKHRGFWLSAHPLIRWAGLIIKNILGAGLVALGIILAIPGVPGSGTLVILLGIILLDFPGKRRLEKWFISRPKIL